MLDKGRVWTVVLKCTGTCGKLWDNRKGRILGTIVYFPNWFMRENKFQCQPLWPREGVLRPGGASAVGGTEDWCVGR